MVFRNSDSFESFSFGSILRLPLRYLGGLFQFLIDEWSTSRDGFAFLRSVPAILGVLSIAVPLILATYLLPKRLSKFYTDRVRYFLEVVQEYGNAENMGWKLASVNPDNRESYFLLGETMFAQSQSAKNDGNDLLAEVKRMQADEVMNYAADFSENSSFMAHIWLANRVFETILAGKDSPELRDVARKHLKFVSDNADQRTRTESIRANLSLVRLYMNEADFESAEKILKTILKDDFETLGHVEAALLNAQLLKNTRPAEEVNNYCTTTVERLLNLAIKYPDFFEIWRAAVELTLFREQGLEIREFDRARGIIRTGIELTTDAQVRRRIAALGSLILLRQSRMMEELQSPPDPQARFLLRLGLLALSIKDNPMEPASYHEVLDLINDREKFPDADEWRARAAARIPILFRERNFNIPADFLFIFNVLDGVSSGLKGNLDFTKNEWLQASVQSPITPVVINNFMMILMARSADHADAVLKMLDVAEQLFPANEVLFIRGRSEVYYVTKDWEKARDEFEEFIAKEPNQVEAYKKLIEIYNHLNDSTRAAQTQQRLNRLEAEVLQRDMRRIKQ